MSIQGNINQAITLGAALYTQTPKYQTKVEEAKKVAESEKLLKADKLKQDALLKSAEKTFGPGVSEATKKAYGKLADESTKESMETYKKVFELNPTTENFQRLADMQKNYEANAAAFEEINRQKIEMANQQAEAKKNTKKTQKRKFMDTLSKQTTSLGGTIGDLPENMQKTIAKQYSKSERKKLMDIEDNKENK